MIKLKHILKESKQVGMIYHYTSIQSLFDIMEDNRLNAGTFEKDKNVISFTRDKFFGNRLRTGVETDVRILFDGNKLSNKYKIGPYQFTGSSKINLDIYDDEFDWQEWEESIGDEQEERLFLPKGERGIEKVSDYIIKIEFPKNYDKLRFVLQEITPFGTKGWTTKGLYLALNNILKKCVRKDEFAKYIEYRRPYNDWWNTGKWTMKDLVRLLYEPTIFDESKVKANFPKMEQELSKYFGKPVTFTMET